MFFTLLPYDPKFGLKLSDHFSQGEKVFVFYTSNDVLCYKSLGNGSGGGGASIRLMEG